MSFSSALRRWSTRLGSFAARGRRGSVLYLVLFAGCCGYLAMPAAAQPVLQQHRLSEVRFNRASCDADAADVLLDIDVAGLTDPPYLYREMLVQWTGSGTEVNCPDYLLAESVFDVVPEQNLEPVSARFLQTFMLRPTELLGPEVCDAPGARRVDLALCLYVIDAFVDTVVENGIALRYDTELPPTPEILELLPGDGSLTVTWSTGTDAGTPEGAALVQYRSCAALDAGTAGPSDAAVDPGIDTGGGTPGTADGGVSYVEAASVCGSPISFTEKEFSDGEAVLTGLENGVEYEVRVRLKDDFDNEGLPSEAVLGTPRPQLGPLELYNGAGSPYGFSPSCAHVSKAEAANFAWLCLSFWLLRRRRRRNSDSGVRPMLAPLATLSIVIVLAFSSVADAQVVDSSARAKEKEGMAFSIGVFIGPYAPNLDAERVGGEPVFPIYDCFFDNQVVPEAGLQVGWRLTEKIGTLELNLGANFSQMRGQGQPVAALSAAAGGDARCLEPAPGSVELTILKLKPALSYRFTPLHKHFDVPVVPYARAGFVFAGYGFSSAGAWDAGAGASTREPAGLMLGYEGALGVQLSLDLLGNLDPFTPNTTQRARANGIFEDAYLFAEVYVQPLDNFGRPGFVFSPQDRVFQTQLPMSMNFGISMDIP